MNTKNIQVKFGFTLDSEKAFDAYMDATGKVPPKMPQGKNTLLTPFTIKDDDGIERAALLIYQTGFKQTPEEKARDEQASGLSLAVALDVPVPQGEAALEQLVRQLLGE